MPSGSIKRPRETLAPTTSTTAGSKRVKVENVPNEAVRKDHKAEEDMWRAKWIKIFPTLVFHFEVGLGQGNGKALVNRVTKMGAVSGAASRVEFGHDADWSLCLRLCH